jgi:hypothetical protein
MGIAVIGNGGVGDAADFMNVVTDAKGSVITYKDTTQTIRPDPPPPPPVFSPGTPEAMPAGLILGPMTTPVLGAVSSAISFLSDLF